MKPFLPLALLFPATVAAQGFSVTPYAAHNRSLPDRPSLLGASLTTYSSVFGLRLGGGYGSGQWTPLGASAPASRERRGDVWTADADLVLDGARVPLLGTLLGGFAPSAFVGVGAQGVRGGGASSGYTPLWSYGGALSRSIVGPLQLATEARYRVPYELRGRAIPAGYGRGWEYRVGLALHFGGGGSAAPRPTAALPRPLPSPASARPRTRPASASARSLLATADQYLGTRYVYGGATPRGFDCSGFVQYVFRRQGVPLPRTSRQQATVGERVGGGTAALRAGDLMLFASNGVRIDHVAVYAGDGRIIHSSSSGGGVRYDDLSTRRGRWFVDHHVASRRVLADGRSLVRSLDAARVAGELDPPDRAPVP